MKKIVLLLITCAAVMACTPKTAKSTAATAPGVAAAPIPEPTETHVTAAQTRFPGVTLTVLKKGREIYNGPCMGCHGDAGIMRRDDKQWEDVLNAMAPKARLSPEDKDAVWKYIMAVRLASTK